MFTLQIAIQQLANRQQQVEQKVQITIRFGNLQTQIQIINSNGGKRMVLDLNLDQLYQMFLNYCFGLFFTNQAGKYFSLLNLSNLVPNDKVSGREVYFYNDLQEIIYSAKLSINFIQYKNIRVPNQQKIKNHKKLDDYFRKPQVPQAQVSSKLLTTFLYGNHKQSTQKNQPIKHKKASKMKSTSKTCTNQFAKQAKYQKQICTTQIQKQIKVKEYYQNQNVFPPPMQFTNKQEKQVAYNKLNQLSQTSPQIFQNYLKQKNSFSETMVRTFNKYKKDSKTDKDQYHHLAQNKQNQNQQKQLKDINRNELRILAKKEIQNYEGKTNIKIPMFKNGKLQLVQLNDLSEEQILQYVKMQKVKEQAEKEKQFIRKLQEKQKQNKDLKDKLQKQKTKLREKQIKTVTEKINNAKKSSYIAVKKYDQINQEPDYQQNSEKEKTEDYDYQSDFESMSIGNSQIKSRVSLSQKKPKQQESVNYQQYQQDFQSFSQSQLNYSQKKSNSDISQSWRSSLYKK